jgi:hypothetical protein
VQSLHALVDEREAEKDLLQELRLAKKDSQRTIDNLNSQLEGLTKTLILAEQNSRRFSVIEDQTRPKKKILLSDCELGPIQQEVAAKLREIFGNDSTKSSVKLITAVKYLCEFYEGKLKELGNQKLLLESFVGDLTLICFKKRMSLESFVSKSAIPERILNGLRQMISWKEESESAAKDLQMTNRKLKSELKKVEKQRDTVQNESMNRMSEKIKERDGKIGELQRKVDDLVREKSRLELGSERQRSGQIGKSDSIAEYEVLIEQLKRKCKDQKDAIENMSTRSLGD